MVAGAGGFPSFCRNAEENREYLRVVTHVVDGAVFVTSRGLTGFTEARSKRGPVFDSYDQVIQAVEARCGAEVAALFAQPVATRDAAGKARSVSWYASRRGNIQTWRDLDLDAQAAARSQVAAAMQQIVRMLDDPEAGEDLRRWVNLPSLADSLHLVGGRAVLVNWGLLPDSAVSDLAERERLFRAGLGSIAPWAELPPLLEDGPELPVRGAGRTGMPAGSSVPTPAPAAVLNEPAPAVSRARTWMGPAIACLVAAIILIVLLIPGVLRYPEAGLAVSADSTSEAAAVLRTRIADMQRALSSGICEPEALVGTVGSLSVPAASGAAPGYAPDTTLPPYGDVTAPTSIAPPPESVAPPLADLPPGATPPSNAGLANGPSADASSPTDLVDYLDAAAVLVLARAPNAMSTGTGFFVNATDIVTNHHVIEAEGAEFFVASKRLGHPVPATLVAKSASSVPGEADFAVLRIAAAPGVLPLKLANDVPRASNVMAFGFPAFVMESDSEFQCLMSSGTDASSDCMPLGSVTMGVVMAIQHGDSGNQLVLHSAVISEGNSGGPLVDYCGRSVGVNTFGRRDVERVQQLNFAQHASSLEAFLTSNGVAYNVEASGCRLVPTETVSAGVQGTGAPANSAEAGTDTPAPDASTQETAPAPAPAPAAAAGDATPAAAPTAVLSLPVEPPAEAVETAPAGTSGAPEAAPAAAPAVTPPTSP